MIPDDIAYDCEKWDEHWAEEREESDGDLIYDPYDIKRDMEMGKQYD